MTTKQENFKKWKTSPYKKMWDSTEYGNFTKEGIKNSLTNTVAEDLLKDKDFIEKLNTEKFNTLRGMIPIYGKVNNKYFPEKSSEEAALDAYCDQTTCGQCSFDDFSKIINLSEQKVQDLLKTSHEYNGQRRYEQCISRIKNSDSTSQKTISTDNEIDGIKVKPHTKKQYQCLKLLSDMGLEVYAATDNQKTISKLPSIKNYNINHLEFTSDHAINKILKRIDVIAGRDKKLKVLLEIEDSTNVEHSVLKMHQLIDADPNINIRVFIVAPDEKRNEVFKIFKIKVFKNLNIKCIFYSKLDELLENHGNISDCLTLNILDKISEDVGQNI